MAPKRFDKPRRSGYGFYWFIRLMRILRELEKHWGRPEDWGDFAAISEG